MVGGGCECVIDRLPGPCCGGRVNESVPVWPFDWGSGRVFFGLCSTRVLL